MGRREKIILAGAIGAAFVGFFLTLRRPVAPPQMAKDQADALLARDVDALWAMADPHEVQAVGWTKPKADTFLRQFVFPAFEGAVRISKDEKPMARNGGDQGSYLVTLKTPEGHRFELETTADRHTEGTHAWLQSLITQAWFLRYMKRHNVDFSSGIWIPARLEGVREDRVALERLGMKGLYVGRDERADYEKAHDAAEGWPEYQPVKPWDQVEKGLIEAKG